MDFIYIEEDVQPLFKEFNIIDRIEPVVLSFDETDRGRPDYKILSPSKNENVKMPVELGLILRYCQIYNKKLYIV